MPVYVIDTVKPKNGLDFPVVEAVDVAVEGYTSLADAVTHFATDTAIAALTAALDEKANTSDVNTAVANLQGQINQIVISASAESVVAPEVAAARVDADGTSYSTLKERLDADSATVETLSENVFKTYSSANIQQEKYVRYDTGNTDSYPDTQIVTFEVREGEVLTYEYTRSTPNTIGLAFYSETGGFISGVQAQVSEQTITVPRNAKTCKATTKIDKEFQISFTTSTEDIVAKINDSEKKIETKVTLSPTEIVEDKYIRYDTGAVDVPVGGGWRYATFPVAAGQKFIYNAIKETPDIRGLAFYTEAGAYLSGVQMLQAVQTVTVPANAALCKASLHLDDTITLITDAFAIADEIGTAKKTAQTAVDTVNSITDDIYDTVSITNLSHVAESYIRDTGVIGYDTGGVVDYFMCEPNTTYVITTTVIASNFRAGWTVERPRQNVQAFGIVGNPTGNEITIKTGDTALYLVFGRRVTDTEATVVAKVDKASKSVLNPLYAFTNITCIGDSLTHGVVTTDSQGGYRIAKYPYPAVLQRIIGATVEEIAHGGYSASDWWSAYSERIASKTNQLAIVFLGTNDGLTDTVDTDCSGDDYTTYADTDTGCYGKILGKLKEVGAKIILVQCFTGDNNYHTTNDVIQQFADKFSCGIVATKRLTNPAYHYYPDLSGSDTLHFNDLGYSAFAEFLVNQISEMSSDYMKFIIPV